METYHFSDHDDLRPHILLGKEVLHEAQVAHDQRDGVHDPHVHEVGLCHQLEAQDHRHDHAETHDTVKLVPEAAPPNLQLVLH